MEAKKRTLTLINRQHWRLIVSFTLALLITSTNVYAFQVYHGKDFRILWDTTLKYSSVWRVKDQDSGLIDNINADDGDRNFDTGCVSNRFDGFSEVDVLYKNIGFRLSGAAWYDFAYNSDNDNNSPSTVNSFSEPYDKFTDDTQDLHGKDAELLDAFVFGKTNLKDVLISGRIGQFAQLWGESLFFATNGISYGQAPLDFVKLLSVPGTKAKELFRPVPQVSLQIQPFASLSFLGFYQWDWEESRLPGAGSYVSSTDILDEGGERLFIPGTPPGTALFRGDDKEADDSGQWGVAIRYQPSWVDSEFGLYYYVFNERSPQVYLRPGLVNTPGGPVPIDPSVINMSIGKIGEYYLVYPEDIKVLGASFSTQIGEANVSGEISYRMDTPLVSTPQVVLPGQKADNDHDPLYAVGDTLHCNLSTTYFLRPCKLWDGGTFLGEIGWNRRINVDKNREALDPSRDRTAWGLRCVFEPAWFQVAPGWDIKVPLGLGYNPKGKSAVDPKFNGGANEGGDFSIGLSVDYLQVWKASLKYTNYFGSKSWQALQDRDLIAFSLERTF